jgi:histidinol dehydrogenase
MKRFSLEEFRLARPCRQEFEEMETVRRIIAEVRAKGDAALRDFTLEYDAVSVDSFRIEQEEIKRAALQVDPALASAIGLAAANIRKFARAQRQAYRDFVVEILPGLSAGQVVVPIERAGVYVPGGLHPLVSSLLMGAIPARIAGVRELVVCTPPGAGGAVPAAVLGAAKLCGVDEVYRVGGAQAVAAMAYGTESIRKVDKIVGPGNAYVTAAKKCVCGDVGVDFTAGPSELMVIADQQAAPSFIAADLVAQAEHDARAAAVLVTDSEELAAKVEGEVEAILEKLSTAAVARESLRTQGAIVLVPCLEAALDLAEECAPEHLELFVAEAEALAGRLRNFGSLFIGQRTAVALGDYAAGINHILPTERAARYTGGLTVGDFLKIQTTLRVDERGLAAVGPAAARMARAEGLEAHALSLDVRGTCSFIPPKTARRPSRPKRPAARGAGTAGRRRAT